MDNITGVVLAAGKGVRMKSKLPKVMHPVAGKPMVNHVMQAARTAGARRLVMVISPDSGLDQKIPAEPGDCFAVQREQLGTGHALMMAEEQARDADIVLVLCGDTPLITTATLVQLIDYHKHEGAYATVLTASLKNPAGYGRIIRDFSGQFVKIVEDKDCTPAEKEIAEINSGMYCFHPLVFESLRKISPNNAQGEYYLTDALLVLKEMGHKVTAVSAASEEEIYGINNRVQLAEAERVMRRRKCEELMIAGVTIIDPASTFVDTDVQVGEDTVIYPFTMLEANTVIGTDCVIGPGARIIGSTVGSRVVLENAKIIESVIGDDCEIGPYVRFRPETVLKDEAKVGGFVDIKKSVIGEKSKVPHLSYIGDTTIGADVNIGAGTITCNYDGYHKYETIIEDGAFIGSNTNLVAPVTIGRRAVTGAGSTITKNLPAEALGVERAPQKNIESYRARLEKKSSE